ncbi:LysR family transcriptional regulator [Undibacterium sp. Di27W]|uniref:LysR family transcriptional regulator n=1 Tax=Undibacterium sp. Di27W TaxID=3413036 RepID=UPI003BF02EB4
MQKVDTKNLPLHDQRDLNQLHFLRALLEQASVTRAGEQLGMSQPAASRATARLRSQFDDPLLVRSGRGYLLTPMAIQLLPQLRDILGRTDALFEQVQFNPASARRTFQMATTDYGMSAILLGLIPHLQQQGPQLSLRVDAWGSQTLERMERGELDAALYVGSDLPPDFHRRKLFTDGYALVCAANHPLLQHASLPARALLEQATSYPQFAARYPLRHGYATDDVYTELGLARPFITLEAPYFYVGNFAAEYGNVVAVVPERAARAWQANHAISVISLDIAELAFDYCLIWHESRHRDPAMKWFRELLVSKCQ